MQEFKLKPSRYLLAFLLLTHLGAIAIITTLTLAFFIKFIIILIVMIILSGKINDYILQNRPSSITRVIHLRDEEWLLINKNNQIQPAQLSRHCLRTSMIIVLNFKLPARRKAISVPILRDSIDSLQFKTLSAELLYLDK